MSEPVTKKIKLSLEPSIDNSVVDITNTGQEIFKTETTLPEQLMQSVDRIWFERGEWKDISENSLLQSIERKRDHEDLEHDQALDNLEDQDALISTQPGFDIVKLRESVINKLFHAKSEIDVALDVINILAAGNRSSAAVKDLVLPAGSLTATYVTKPKPTTKAQLESIQLNLGLKRKKQKQAADFLKKSAASLKSLVEKEQVFWDEALDLRRNNWHMQANTQPGGINAGSSFFVQYGYSEVGSDFNEASVGELKRSNDVSNKLQMSLPHSTSRKLAVRVSQSHMGRLVGQDEFSEGVLGITEIDNKQPAVFPTSMIGTSHSEIQNQLAEAHSTVFDAELFSDILAEAQALNSNVRFPDDEIVINIDGQIDLSILKVPVHSHHVDAMPIKPSSEQIISRTIDLSFRLLLLQHQRYNMWKTRAKVLSFSHKIHQLLHDSASSTLQQPASSSNGAAATTAATTATASNAPSPNPAANNPTPNNSNGNTPAATNGVGNVNNSTTAVGSVGSVGSVTVTAATAAAAAAAAATTRARTKASHSITRDLPQHIPILLPIMSLTRFWVQFDRVRHVVHSLLSPLMSGLSISTHFKFAHSALSRLSTSKTTYDMYPGYSEVALSLGISILKGPALHFGLNQSGAISVCLPQTTVVLQNVSEFEAFLSREIKVICLRTVCEVANKMIQRHSGYLNAAGSDQQRFLWQVDQVDEAIHGSILWQNGVDPCWRNITVRLDESTLLFRLNPVHDVKLRVFSMDLARTTGSAMSFKERVCVMIKHIMMNDDGIMTHL